MKERGRESRGEEREGRGWDGKGGEGRRERRQEGTEKGPQFEKNQPPSHQMAGYRPEQI